MKLREPLVIGRIRVGSRNRTGVPGFRDTCIRDTACIHAIKPKDPTADAHPRCGHHVLWR